MFKYPSEDAIEVFKLLKETHNVIITGPPAVGKSFLMAELRYWFSNFKPIVAYDPEGDNPFPDTGSSMEYMISPKKDYRKVFVTTFHQNTKYRNFVSGLSPAITDTMKFKVETGPFYNAIIHAQKNNATSLVEIDELNRGPAVAIFGDLITGIESDKRTLPDGKIGDLSYVFELLHEDGTLKNISIPHDLYIIAAMNQADSAIEPIDVAFLRRFTTYRLNPDEKKLRELLELSTTPIELGETCGDTTMLLEALVQAWVKLNLIIGFTKGSDYKIGHGFIIGVLNKAPAGLNFDQVLEYVNIIWSRFYAHLTEVFYGDVTGLAAILNANDTLSPFESDEQNFANNVYPRLQLKKKLNVEGFYNLFRAITRIEL